MSSTTPTPPPSDDAPPFYTRYGFARTGDPAAPLTIESYPQICRAGALQATIIASAIDLVGGLHTRAIAGVDATFTADLSLRIPQPSIPTRLVARGEPLRVGRRLVTTRVTLASNDMPYAFGTTTFTRIPRDPANAPELARLSTPDEIPRHPLTRSLTDEVGIEAIDAAHGHVGLTLRPALLNPEGIMQGALVALLVESAAIVRAESDRRCAQVVTEMDLRYLAAASRGPVETRAAWIGEPEIGMLQVEVRDCGREDRLTTAALVRIADAPGA